VSAKEVVVVDYQIGNVFSVCNAVSAAGCSPVLTGDPKRVANAERLILPGVGAFARAMQELEGHGLVEPILKFVDTGRPFLGICVGMQMLMDESTEFGVNPGLGLIPGRVDRIPETTEAGEPHPVPHISWGTLTTPPGAGADTWAGTPLQKLSPGRSSVYFVHSFMCNPINQHALLATVDYDGRPLTAAIRRDNITGVQFHPERSGIAGQKVLAAFLDL
jgi:imidazole glycerol-phosphate synthase subunit HisH